MAKDVITVDGKDLLVREDTARAFRGVKWAHIVVALGLGLMVALAVGFFLYAAKDGKLESPSDANRTVTNQ